MRKSYVSFVSLGFMALVSAALDLVIVGLELTYMSLP